MNVWPPVPPEPPHPRRTPWRPDPGPLPASSPGSSSWSLIVDAGPDWLAERLIERRFVALAGELDRDAANRLVAELALLDASGDEPVTMQLSGVSADLDTALTVIDALDLMGVDVHARCLGTISGAAVAILAVADHRTAGPHATVHLCAPPRPHRVTGRDLSGDDLDAQAREHQRQLRLLHERIAEACHRPVDAVADDVRAGRVLTAEQARDYGLVDTCTGPRTGGEPSRGAGSVPPGQLPDAR